MTTTTDATVDFAGAAAMYQALRPTGDAKLDAEAAVESGVFKEVLRLLVGLGLLSAEQARALWELASGGTYLPLPPIPWPGSGTTLGLYDHLRAKLGDGATDSIFSDIVEFVDSVLHISQGIAAIVHEVQLIWHEFAGG